MGNVSFTLFDYTANISVPSFDQVMNGSKVILTDISNAGYEKTGLESSTVYKCGGYLFGLSAPLAVASWRAGKKATAIALGFTAIASVVATALAFVNKVYLSPTQEKPNCPTGQYGPCSVTYNYPHSSMTHVFG
ncbi:MAG: hypothetical protein JSR46_02310 [Verrucomicrobia bacterium]|nr:hypothetical protein [Verrucomicrobiota bacterium]